MNPRAHAWDRGPRYTGNAVVVISERVAFRTMVQFRTMGGVPSMASNLACRAGISELREPDNGKEQRLGTAEHAIDREQRRVESLDLFSQPAPS